MTQPSAEEAFDLIQSDTEAIPLLGPGNGGSSHQSWPSVAERWRGCEWGEGEVAPEAPPSKSRTGQ